MPNTGGPTSQNAERQFRFIRFLCDDLSWAKLVRFRAGAQGHTAFSTGAGKQFSTGVIKSYYEGGPHL